MSRLTPLFSLLLALSICLSLVGCTETDQKNTPETELSASDVSIHDYQKHRTDALLADFAVGPWLAQAMEREQVTNALLCPADATNGRLHCYLYVGAFREGDTLAFGVNPTEGTLLIRHTAADASATNSPHVVSFWINAEELPDVELFQNEVSVGLVISYTGAALPD